MTYTVELTPELETQAKTLAEARGKPVEVYLADFLADFLPKSDADFEREMAAFEADLDALVSGREQAAVLPPEAYTRASIYGDHD